MGLETDWIHGSDGTRARWDLGQMELGTDGTWDRWDLGQMGWDLGQMGLGTKLLYMGFSNSDFGK